jgi:nucleoside-triphosphatase THEP1
MKVIIISGPQNSSKTTTLKKYIKEHNQNYLGYVSESSQNKSIYYLRNLLSNEIIKLMQVEDCLSNEKIGKYNILLNAFEKASETLLNQVSQFKGQDFVVVIDEVGRLELLNSGFDALLNKLIELDIDLILCVRDSFLEDVCKKYNFTEYKLIKV